MLEINPVQMIVCRDIKALMDQALAVHSCVNFSVSQQFYRAELEHTGSNPTKHIVTRSLLKNDVFNTGKIEKLRQEQPRRPGTDDCDLRFFNVTWHLRHCQNSNGCTLMLAGVEYVISVSEKPAQT